MASAKIQRLVDVIELVLARRTDGARLSDVVGDLDSPLSSTHDLLKSMTGAGLLTMDADRVYRIGPRFIQLAVCAARSLDVRVVAHAHLEHLAADLSHDVYLAVRTGGSVVYVDRVPGRGRAAVDIRLGDPIPLYASAAGKLFCSFADDLAQVALQGPFRALTGRTLTTAPALSEEFEAIRSRGYSVSYGEAITGILGAAVPVWSATGGMLAAVHVSGFRDLIGDDDIPGLITAMQRCAVEIARAMGSPAASRPDLEPYDANRGDRSTPTPLTTRPR